jgi:hypothetical protein
MGRALSEPPPQARRWVAGRSRQPCATLAVVGPEHRGLRLDEHPCRAEPTLIRATVTYGARAVS